MSAPDALTVTAVTAATAATTNHVIGRDDLVVGSGWATGGGLVAGTSGRGARGGLSMFRYWSVHPSASMNRSWPWPT